ncbi:MAG: bifunctional isocitrate dehydrogenase kinase/phosphatase [Planctomycetales bacterium]|nr:bifunctional isocitrate dehydrogenase kinase/phosphatase [Planctomycetales bacterium]
MDIALTDSRLASLGANVIANAYAKYHEKRRSIDWRAKTRFEKRQWAESHADSVKKLELYRVSIDEAIDEIDKLLDGRIHETQLWMGIKAVFSNHIAERHDWEVAETFFNSVTRRIFTTVGVDPHIEFVDTDFATPPTTAGSVVYSEYTNNSGTLTGLINSILDDYPFDTEYEDRERDVCLIAARLHDSLSNLGIPAEVPKATMLKPVFYRGRAAYLVGRVAASGTDLPFVICLDNPQGTIVVDAVILDENQASILFSFAYSYFRVLTDRPHDVVQFLQSIMPRKRSAELYISLGYNKHGKTELYRNLLHHLAHSDDHFELAAGVPGMVMIVFTLPSYDLVFKVIRDRFAKPKDVTRRDVMDKYRLVFRHDRAGRLIDAQEFEHLKFRRTRFSEELLGELGSEAANSVEITPDYVIVRHAYIERRLVPLNVYVRNVDEQAGRAAIRDYGQAIKDLMATNIFPGDLLLKNFGVTRHGRVVFYDYDELCLLTDCKFRRIPPATAIEDQLSAETWFSVGDHDVFPEQFPEFLGLTGPLREEFISHHGDLFDIAIWRKAQESHRVENLIRIFPYPQSIRLQPSRGTTSEHESSTR